MKYQLVSEDDHLYTIRHPDGSDFPVAKNGLSESTHKKIKALQMAEGGIVPEAEELSTSVEQPSVILEEPMATPVEPVATEPVLAEPVRAPAATPTRAPQPEVTTPMQDVAQSFALKESGISGLANVQSQAAKEQAAVQAQLVADTETRLRKIDEHKAALDIENEALRKGIQDYKIDPNRLWSNASTGNKILAAIGVALSGLGAGLQGHGAKNLALESIQKQIEDDVMAQRSELGKRQSLLSENMKRYGDLNTAQQATILQLNTIAQAKIAQIASKSGSQEAVERAKIAIADLKLGAAQIKQSVAEKAALQNASSQGLNEAQAQAAPEDLRKRLVKVGDKYVPVLTEDKQKKATEVMDNFQNVESNLNRLIELRNQYGSETVPGPVKTEMKTLATNLRLILKEQKKLGTLDKGSQEVLDELVSDPSSFGFVGAQYDALKSSIRRETQASLKNYGINDVSGIFGKEPDQIKHMGGKPYKKVPGGWEPI